MFGLQFHGVIRVKFERPGKLISWEGIAVALSVIVSKGQFRFRARVALLILDCEGCRFFVASVVVLDLLRGVDVAITCVSFCVSVCGGLISCCWGLTLLFIHDFFTFVSYFGVRYISVSTAIWTPIPDPAHRGALPERLGPREGIMDLTHSDVVKHFFLRTHGLPCFVSPFFVLSLVF